MIASTSRFRIWSLWFAAFDSQGLSMRKIQFALLATTALVAWPSVSTPARAETAPMVMAQAAPAPEKAEEKKGPPAGEHKGPPPGAAPQHAAPPAAAPAPRAEPPAAPR
ncbi:hypothetical protein NML43_25865, partial [Rhodopseudomonas palustris]|nr:hypothetical protein [Rhodopseudomonas palustris]